MNKAPHETSRNTINDGGHAAVPRVAFWGILVALVLLVSELGAALALQILYGSRVQYLLWNPDPALAHEAWLRSSSKVDQELGWPASNESTSGPRDKAGAKRNEDFPDVSNACLSAYGDSFIWGDDVPLTEGWIEQLSRRLGCRVANYGVSGYGTDQAFLRFRRNSQDRAPVIVLGIFPDNIVRNVNQYRAFMGFGLEPFWVKGRFVLDKDRNLQWVDRPQLDEAAYVDMHRRPDAFLPHEYLLPDSRDGPVTVGFPYTLALTRFALAPRNWNRLRGATPWSDFYRADHPSGAVPLTLAIARSFEQEAHKRGARVLIVMQPSAGSFRVWERQGESDYAPFLAAMAASGIAVFDPMPSLREALAGRSYCILYAIDCGGHFSVAGGALVASTVEVQLKRTLLIPQQSRRSD